MSGAPSPTDVRRARALAAGAAGAACMMTLGTRPTAAQAAAAPAAADSAAADSAAAPERAPAPGRLSVALHYGTFRPAGGGALFALLDRALAPGGRALRPRLVGGELRLAVARRWQVLAGVEGGQRTVGSVSRVAPAAGPSVVPQHTSLALTSAQYAGVEWQLARWRGPRGGRDRVRVELGAGVGVANYRLRQWGEFVDVDRRLAFADDFHSEGRGGFRYASAGVEVPLTRGVTLAGTARRQAGSAPMSADYARFDRIDLGGTRLTAGLRVRPVLGGAAR